jgi:mRNA interferase MazF
MTGKALMKQLMGTGTKKYPKRGDIWWVNLDPTVGAETKKTRPCLILSMDVVNCNRRTVLAVPLSSSPRAHPPVTVSITCQKKEGVAIVDQLRAVSKERLSGFIEKASSKELKMVTRALQTIIEA